MFRSIKGKTKARPSPTPEYSEPDALQSPTPLCVCQSLCTWFDNDLLDRAPFEGLLKRPGGTPTDWEDSSNNYDGSEDEHNRVAEDDNNNVNDRKHDTGIRVERLV